MSSASVSRIKWVAALWLAVVVGASILEGGITIARGHAGESEGRRAVGILAADSSSLGIRTPVFGCPLFSEDCPRGEIECTL